MSASFGTVMGRAVRHLEGIDETVKTLDERMQAVKGARALQAELRETGEATAKAHTRVRTLRESMAGMGQPSEAMQAALAEAVAEAGCLDAALAEQKRGLDRYQAELRDTGVDLADLGRAEREPFPGEFAGASLKGRPLDPLDRAPDRAVADEDALQPARGGGRLPVRLGVLALVLVIDREVGGHGLGRRDDSGGVRVLPALAPVMRPGRQDTGRQELDLLRRIARKCDCAMRDVMKAPAHGAY